MACKPTPTEHCCWVDGQLCQFFDASPGLEFRCSLRTELGSWDAVHRDNRYLRNVGVHFKRSGIAYCGDWEPSADNPCSSCGWDGS